MKKSECSSPKELKTNLKFNQRDLDIAWAAGLFEGEGCIKTRHNSNGFDLILSMTDKEWKY